MLTKLGFYILFTNDVKFRNDYSFDKITGDNQNKLIQCDH